MAQARQMERELEKTFSDFAGIDRVRVHIALSDTRLQFQRDTRSRAAVVIWSKDSSALVVNNIKAVVASISFELEPANIEVIINQSAPERPSTASSHGESNYRLALVMVLVLCLTGAMGILAVGIRRRISRREKKHVRTEEQN